MTEQTTATRTPGDLELPAVGFGTYRLTGAAGIESICSAIDNGYRLLDSAARYDNEGALGAAVRRTSVSRDDLVVTSKLPGATIVSTQHKP
jgi:diketogulonate reductase-like aldo/keto reductase